MSAGEMTVTGAVGGRRLTLDPLLPGVPLEITPRRVESTIPCGFRVEWFSGERDDGVEFSLNAGAGCGSRWLTLSVTMPDGSHRDECVDMGDVLRAWVERVASAEPTPIAAGKAREETA